MVNRVADFASGSVFRKSVLWPFGYFGFNIQDVMEFLIGNYA